MCEYTFCFCLLWQQLDVQRSGASEPQRQRPRGQRPGRQRPGHQQRLLLWHVRQGGPQAKGHGREAATFGARWELFEQISRREPNAPDPNGHRSLSSAAARLARMLPVRTYTGLLRPRLLCSLHFCVVWVCVRVWRCEPMCILYTSPVYQSRQAHYVFISPTTSASPFSPPSLSTRLWNFDNGTWKMT